MKRTKKMRRILLPVLVLALALVLVMPAMQVQAAKKVKLNKTSLTLKVGETAKLKLLNAPKGKKIKWTSSGISVVYVWEDGTVEAKKIGKAKIKAAVGGKKYACVVTVIKAGSGSDKNNSNTDANVGSSLQNTKGKNASDVKILEKAISEQKAQGATVSTDLDNAQYFWLDGRITNIAWNDCGLTGKLSLSGLPELLQMMCESNQLTSLDVSNCKKLWQVECRNVALPYPLTGCMTSLNVSGCVSLKSLSCLGNQITSLNLKECTKLENLSCDDNPLGSLDLSKCTKLKTLTCRRCGLTSLDVSKCTKLEDLNCYDNQIASLDLSKNKKLKNLYCDDTVVVTR